MRNCSSCAHRNPDDVERCVECGTLLDAPEVQPTGIPSALEAELISTVKAGRRIEAIKLYRERTGAGLKEARDAVDKLAGREGVSPPPGGCFGVLALLLALGGAAVLIACS